MTLHTIPYESGPRDDITPRYYLLRWRWAKWIPRRILTFMALHGWWWVWRLGTQHEYERRAGAEQERPLPLARHRYSISYTDRVVCDDEHCLELGCRNRDHWGPG